jgi:hypothetical protein
MLEEVNFKRAARLAIRSDVVSTILRSAGIGVFQ